MRYTPAQHREALEECSATLSQVEKYFSLPCFSVFPVELTSKSRPPERIVNFQANMHLNVTNSYYYFKESFRYYIYEHQSIIGFKPKKLTQILHYKRLVINNISTNNIDRSNINFRISSQLLLEKYNFNNPYYLNLVDSKLQFNINNYYSANNKYKNYKIHEYERKNKIPIPITRYTKNPTPSYPTYFPPHEEIIKLQYFVQDTAKYVLPIPSPPPYYNPFDIKHTFLLDEYFSDIKIDYHGNPPHISYEDAVTKKEKLFPNKKYLFYDYYKDVRCYFCNKTGHMASLCEEIVSIDSLFDPVLHRLAVFVSHYPRNIISQRFGIYSRLIWGLPDIYGQ